MQLIIIVIVSIIKKLKYFKMSQQAIANNLNFVHESKNKSSSR